MLNNKVVYGRRLRDILKSSRYMKGYDIYKAILIDIVDLESSFLAVEGNKSVLDLLIKEKACKEGRYLLQRNRNGKVTIISHFRNNCKFDINTKCMETILKEFGVKGGVKTPNMRYTYSNKHGMQRAGRNLKHIIFSSNSYTGAEIIKCALRDMYRESCTYTELQTSIDLINRYVMSGKITDNEYYFIKMKDGKLNVYKDKEKVAEEVKTKIHTRKTISMLVEEYKYVKVNFNSKSNTKQEDEE